MRRRTMILLMVALSTVLMTAAPTQATTPGKSGRIVFRRYFNSHQNWGAIYTINPDGTGLRQLTHPPRGILTSNPDWSADGRWIAYGKTRHGSTGCPCSIVIIRPNGTGAHNISDAACPLPVSPSSPADAVGTSCRHGRLTGGSSP
jgi:hypothetical protein